MENQPKDFWDKADIVFRPLNGLLTALAVGLLGYYTSNVLRQRETRETNERVYTELMSSREQAESALRKDMFVSIIQSFLRPQSASLEDKMLNLELLAYNFHESLNLKPLFVHLQKQFEANGGSQKADYSSRLTNVAREITTRQMVLLEQVGKKFGRTVDIDKLRSSPGGLELEAETLTLDGTEREFMLSVLAIDPKRRELTMELGVRTPKESPIVRRLTFHVSYYDFPMIDNTRLSRDQRAAVVLNEFGDSGADMTLVLFPGSYASLKEKVSYDEVVEKLRVLSGSGQ
ncbi:MAG: hypothetical protein HY508_08680 [Acidobacteria bacterium]|nr:hypothetical protein [Acidobacteriota bacterium]